MLYVYRGNQSESETDAHVNVIGWKKAHKPSDFSWRVLYIASPEDLDTHIRCV
jgi:hypothetical protein